MESAEEKGIEPEAAESSEVDLLKGALRKEHDLYLRALADFDNYRRRVERQAEDAARSDKRRIILSLIDVLDSFDRALAHTSEAASPVFRGFQAIYRKLLSLIEAQGVTPFHSVGETFDPALHEAIGSVVSDEYDSGTVAEELQRGYRWGDNVLRPARVRVAE